jgi:hypothetical protein
MASATWELAALPKESNKSADGRCHPVRTRKPGFPAIRNPLSATLTEKRVYLA